MFTEEVNAIRAIRYSSLSRASSATLLLTSERDSFDISHYFLPSSANVTLTARFLIKNDRDAISKARETEAL